MLEEQFRERLRLAIGEPSYPGGLAAAVRTRLHEKPEGAPRGMGLVALALAAMVLAVLIGFQLLQRAGTSARPVPAVTTTNRPAPVSKPPAIPAEDLKGAGLDGLGNLVTRFDITVVDSGHTLTLLGVYSDPARTTMFFRGAGDASPMAMVTDHQGLVNFSSHGGRGVPGDASWTLDGAPQPGPDGMAQIKIVVSNLQGPASPAGMQSIRGNWTWNVAVRVQPSTQLAPPGQFTWGAWTVDIEVVESTPSAVHLQAVIQGASPEDMRSFQIDLLDGAGNQVTRVVGGGGVTVPKGQLNSTNYKNTRINFQWKRPGPGDYFLRFTGPGGVHEVPVTVS
jgi:hypothetical protein